MYWNTILIDLIDNFFILRERVWDEGCKEGAVIIRAGVLNFDH